MLRHKVAGTAFLRAMMSLELTLRRQQNGLYRKMRQSGRVVQAVQQAGVQWCRCAMVKMPRAALNRRVRRAFLQTRLPPLADLPPHRCFDALPQDSSAFEEDASGMRRSRILLPSLRHDIAAAYAQQDMSSFMSGSATMHSVTPRDAAYATPGRQQR